MPLRRRSGVRSAICVPVLACLVILGSQSQAIAAPWDLSGTWEAKKMGARVIAHVQQKGNEIGGVAHVHHPLGKKMTYHFNGTVDGNQVNAAHFSGHSFSGHITPQGQIVGIVTTKKGERVSIACRRR